MMEKGSERFFVCIKSVEDVTHVGIDYEKVGENGRYELAGRMRVVIDDKTHKATIQKDRSTTLEQNYEAYHKCNRVFFRLTDDLKIREVFDEREHDDAMLNIDGNQNKGNSSAQKNNEKSERAF